MTRDPKKLCIDFEKEIAIKKISEILTKAHRSYAIYLQKELEEIESRICENNPCPKKFH